MCGQTTMLLQLELISYDKFLYKLYIENKNFRYKRQISQIANRI